MYNKFNWATGNDSILNLCTSLIGLNNRITVHDQQIIYI